jgi:hypothetical protein
LSENLLCGVVLPRAWSTLSVPFEEEPQKNTQHWRASTRHLRCVHDMGLLELYIVQIGWKISVYIPWMSWKSVWEAVLKKHAVKEDFCPYVSNPLCLHFKVWTAPVKGKTKTRAARRSAGLRSVPIPPIDYSLWSRLAA